MANPAQLTNTSEWLRLLAFAAIAAVGIYVSLIVAPLKSDIDTLKVESKAFQRHVITSEVEHENSKQREGDLDAALKLLDDLQLQLKLISDHAEKDEEEFRRLQQSLGQLAIQINDHKDAHQFESSGNGQLR